MLNWYVVQTVSGQETLADKGLKRQGYHTYLPMLRCDKRISTKLSVPLFPGYEFVRLDSDVDNFSPIRSTRGVVGLVTFTDRPATISDSIIAALQEREHEGLHGKDRWYQPGDNIRVINGSLQGLEGIVTMSSHNRIRALFNLFNGQSIDLTPNDIEPA